MSETKAQWNDFTHWRTLQDVIATEAEGLLTKCLAAKCGDTAQAMESDLLQTKKLAAPAQPLKAVNVAQKSDDLLNLIAQESRARTVVSHCESCMPIMRMLDCSG